MASLRLRVDSDWSYTFSRDSLKLMKTTGPIIVLPRYICGLVTLGASLHLSPRDVIMSWDFADLAIMINTVAIYTYRNDCFPKHQGEVGTFINLMRTRGGFTVAYFHVPWAEKDGALQILGCEAAVVAGLLALVVPALQVYGRTVKDQFSVIQ